MSFPQPIVVTPSQAWDGDAGSWSSFVIHVGTPPQYFRVLPATITGEIWVPVPQGCTSTDPDDCAASRGALPFDGNPSSGLQTNQSSTWTANGLYELDIETSLNLSGNGQYGFDSIGLGFQDPGSPTLLHQVVAGIATKDFYLGVFGLGPKPANFSDFADPQPTLMTNLARQRLIPSLAFGYTAGAEYRQYGRSFDLVRICADRLIGLKGVLGSLTLGGYDLNRLSLNDSISFTFDADDSRSLTVAIQLITATNTLQGVIQPLTGGIFSLIDSSVPDIWLPLDVCGVFEQAFGLSYDPRTDLYLVNDTTHNRLQNLNPLITLKLANVKYGGSFIDINLPYAAFDLQVRSPIYPNPTNYFPLRRASNASQYTLGRMFLQEAYLIVDYERTNFTVASAKFQDPSPQQIVSIHSTNETTGAAHPHAITSSAHSLGDSAIAGISLGAVLVAVIAATGVFLRARRWWKHRKLGHQVSLSEQTSYRPVSREPDIKTEESKLPEVSGMQPIRATPRELSGTPCSELLGSRAATELDAKTMESGRV